MHATGRATDGTSAIDQGRLLYTIKDTARMLSLSDRMVRYLVDRGELSAVKAGRALRVHGASIEKYIEINTQPGRLAS